MWFVEMVDITYYIALPFVWVGGDLLPGEAEECLDLTMAVERAESLSREKGNAGALAYSQTFDTDREIPGEALILKRLGDIPTDLSMLIEWRPSIHVSRRWLSSALHSFH
jgi:hypothetical protein